MARVVCPSCKAGFEAKISREDFAINCITCGIAFNAASFLPSDDYEAVAEQRRSGRSNLDSETRSTVSVIRSAKKAISLPAPATPETRTAGLPFMTDESSRITKASVEAPAEADAGEEGESESSTTTSFFEASVTTSRFKSLKAAQDQPSNPARDSVGRSAASRRQIPSRHPEDRPTRRSAPGLFRTGYTTPVDRDSPNAKAAEEGGNGDRISSRSDAGERTGTKDGPPSKSASGQTSASSETSVNADKRSSTTSVQEKPKKRRMNPLLEGAFGPFEIEAEIARGGVGAVFKARESANGRAVALKVLLDGEEAGDIERERFRRECETAKALALPGMVEIYAVGEVDGKPFMAMELVEGLSLDKIVKQKRPSVNECLVMMQSVARTVGALHDAGYVHRDLKPANILLDRFGAPKVADFGLVKSLDEVTRLTASGLVCGTPAYMAPEQARGDSDDVGPRSDVWALGAVLYVLLTGKPPFQAENALRLMHKITKETPVPPGLVNSKVPREVEAIVLRCLEKNADRRYAHAGELADDIGRFLNGAPVAARTRSVNRMLQSAGEKRGLWIAIGSGVAAVILVAVLSRIALGPGEADPLVREGWSAMRAKDIVAAEKAFRGAIAIDSKHADAYLGLGMALGTSSIDLRTKRVKDTDRFEEALRVTSLAGQLDPKLAAKSEAQLARIYRGVGRYQDVVRELERAVLLDPDNPDYYQALGLAYWNVGAKTKQRHYYLKALREFESVLRLRQDYPKTREYIKILRERDLALRTSSARNEE